MRYKGGGGGGSSANTTTNVNYSPEESARRTQAMDEAQRIYNATSTQVGPGSYPGAKPVAFSPETQVAQNVAVQNAAAAQDQIRAINSGVQYGLNGAMDVNNNPHLQQAMQAAIRPITESYTDPNGVMSQIRTGAEQAGQFGGSRQGIAEGIAAGRYAQQVGDTTAKIATEGYNKGQDTFQKTLMFAPQALEAGMTPVNWLSSVGAQKEGLAQQQEDYGAAQRTWDINAPWMPLQNYANIVLGQNASGTSTTSTGPSAQRSALGQAVGAGMTGLGLYQMMQQYS
jgi:hypothetical protein